MSDTSTIDEPERKIKLQEFHFQRRFLFGCTLSLLIGTILWVIAMSTNRWFIVTGGQGIFVESHRRYFKSSHTGIWKGCRYALLPQPISPTSVRNFTVFAVPVEGLPALKKQFAKNDFIEEFLKVELPELVTITEITESFKQRLFAEWITSHAKFKDLNVKLKNLTQKIKVSKVEYIDPSNEAAMKNFEDLVITVEMNKTFNARLLVPEQIRNVLFEGWEDKGVNFIRLLFYYARNLNIDSSIFKDNVKFIFRPPTPPKRGSVGNGYYYQKWKKCTHHNLFANAAELEADPSVDEELLDLSRASATFAIITLFLMVLGFIFSMYTFMNPRYMFKRLAGGVHFISALSSATVCATVDLSIDHAQEHLRFAFPPEADFVYGYGFYFGILVTAINFFSCLTFIWYSKKKKGNKAFNEEMGMADESVNIGR